MTYIFFMSWPLNLCTIGSFALKGNLVSILHEDSPNSAIAHINVNFEQFGEVWKLQDEGGLKFLFSNFQCPMLLLFPFKNNFSICENPFMNFW